MKSKSVIAVIGVFFLLAIIPLLFFMITGSVSTELLLRTLVDPPAIITWLVIFLTSFYYLKCYRQTFFETLKILNLGPHTYESAKNSFIGRRSFFVFLVIFEIALSYPFVNDYMSNLDANPLQDARFFSLYIPIGVLVVPLISRICSSLWSSTLSIRSIIEQSSIDSIESDISNKVRAKNSDWTYPFLVWIIIVFPGTFAWKGLDYFTMIFLLTVLILFLVVEIKNRRYVNKVKRNILKQLDETKHSWRSEVMAMGRTNYTPSENEIDDAVASYESNLQKIMEQVRKMPVSFFHKGVIGVLVAYPIALQISITLIEVFS